jgi:hypothetical protein
LGGGELVPHGRTDVYVYDMTSHLVGRTVSDGEGFYSLELESGTYAVVGEAWIDSVRYSRTYSDVDVPTDGVRLTIVMYQS